MRSIVLSVVAAFALGGILFAQSPTTVVVVAATPAVPAAQAPAAPEHTASLQAALKMLEDMKAANEETLRKQAATLEQLDEMEKTADQLRIYTKRS